MANLNTITLPDLVANKDILFLKGADSVRSAARDSGIWNVDEWGFGVGDVREYSEFDLEEYASQKDEDDDAVAAKVQQGFTKTVSPIRFGNNIGITWEMRKRNKYMDIEKKLTNLGKMVKNRMELDLQHRLTFGGDTTYTTKEGNSRDISTGDGLSLFNSAHTLTGSSDTYRNRVSGDPQFSRGALEQAEKLGEEQTKNNFGEKMAIEYDILWSTKDPNTVNTIKEVLRSTASPAAPNEGVLNVNMGKYKHVMLPRVATTSNGAVDTTKAKFWGLASSDGNSMFLSIEEEPNSQAPTPNSNADEFTTDTWFFKGRSSYAIVSVVGRGMIASLPVS